MILQKVFVELERVGKDHIELWASTEKFEVDAYEALRDFFHYGFYRNRREEIAKKYYEQAYISMDEITQNLKIPKDKVEFLKEKGNTLQQTFTQKVNSIRSPITHKKWEVHETDLSFLKSVCNDFIPLLKNYDYNVRIFCKGFFQKLDYRELFNRIDDIKGVGQKIASLYLRDMLFLYDRDQKTKNLEKLTQEQLFVMYPIDTWVKNISKKILDEKIGDDKKIAFEIFEKCHEYGVNAVYVNHGIWYIGANSQEFILQNLDKIGKFKVP